ncbi:MAG: phage tail terminator protein [Methylophilus sp.]
MPKPADFSAVWFREVAGAAEYAQVDPQKIPTPTAWLVRSAEKVKHAGVSAEDLIIGFDVVIAVNNARVHQPGETDDLLIKYRQEVKRLLLGWTPPNDVEPIKFNGGRVLRYSAGDLVWADQYSFGALITNYLPDPPLFGSLNYTGDKL